MEIGPDHEAEREIPQLDFDQSIHIILVSSISQVINLINKECASEVTSQKSTWRRSCLGTGGWLRLGNNRLRSWNNNCKEVTKADYYIIISTRILTGEGHKARIMMAIPGRSWL